jgi:allantoin racemase
LPIKQLRNAAQKAMRELLVINPNTSASVSELLQERMQAEVGAAMRVRTVTARFGSTYISDEASYAIAAHAVIDAWTVARTQSNPDAILIACFGDPGIFALREVASVPVMGLAEAAFTEAACHGRFAVVTGGERWRQMLSRLALALGFSHVLAGIHTVSPTGAQLSADPEGARELLANACAAAERESEAQAVIVGGAALAGVAALIQPQVRVPLIDSVAAGARWALGLEGSKPRSRFSGPAVSR